MKTSWIKGSEVRLLVAVAAAAVAAPAAAVNKCTRPDGTVAYQDAPCSGQDAEARRIQIQAAPPAPAQERPSKQAPVQQSPVAAAPPVAPVVAVASPPARTHIEARADACLDWYRPMLRDPRSAYWRDAHYIQDTLNITVVATNGFGGFVNTPAACDFREGRIDDGWTKTQARRRNWAVGS